MSTTKLPALTRVNMRAPGDSEGKHRPARTYSSSRTAFPAHCEYACALEISRRHRFTLDEWVAGAALACAILWAVSVFI